MTDWLALRARVVYKATLLAEVGVLFSACLVFTDWTLAAKVLLAFSFPALTAWVLVLSRLARVPFVFRVALSIRPVGSSSDGFPRRLFGHTLCRLETRNGTVLAYSESKDPKPGMLLVQVLSDKVWVVYEDTVKLRQAKYSSFSRDPSE